MSVDNFLLSATSADLNFPNVRPTLDLNFARVKALDPRITFTRSSGGSYTGPDGILRYAGVNEARFDHDPNTGESLGLLIEESRTNIIYNNTMQGAVVGTPGTLPTNWNFNGLGTTREIVGVGVENGIAYIDIRLTGTFVNTNINFTGNISASVSQVLTGSAYLKLLSGSIPSGWRLAANEFDSGGAFLRTGLTTSISSVSSSSLSLQRITGTFTTGASTAFVTLLLNGINATTTPLDFTLRIGMPQLELGAFATSVIPTTTTTRTRSADVASITGTNFSSWYNQSEGTVYCVYKNNTTDFTTRRNVYTISGNYDIELRSPNIGFNRLRFVFNGQFNSNPLQISASLNQRKTAFSFNQNRHYAYIDSEYVVPATIHINDNTKNILILGNRYQGGTDCLTGTISRLTYYPKALPDTQLQALTR
jgi:hypothetical protein